MKNLPGREVNQKENSAPRFEALRRSTPKAYVLSIYQQQKRTGIPN